MKQNRWFEIDKKGLAQLLERRGKGFVLLELLQNAWDQNVRNVEVRFQRDHARRGATLAVEDDDPEGFRNLAHAFTLFAPSDKKADPGKRGRFNLGEKLVLALCEEAQIITTKGTVVFREDGRRTTTRAGRERGSVFSGYIRMTAEEYKEALDLVNMCIPPEKAITWINGAFLPRRSRIATFRATLPTETADADGVLRRRTRQCDVEVYEPLPGDTAMLYEMGIPVVATGDKYHLNVLQKVPVNMERDNVSPAYLQTLRVLTLNAVPETIVASDANADWVRVASSDTRCDDTAVRRVLELRFGERRVAYDPSDPEANKRAVAQGYCVVAGNSMSKGEWENARRTNAVPPAGQITPSPKPFSPGGKPLTLVPPIEWSDGMRRIAKYAFTIAKLLLDREIVVQVTKDRGWRFNAAYGPGVLTLNYGRLGAAWFDSPNRTSVNGLLIHEFGHHFCTDHLAEEYHESLSDLGAKLVDLALTHPHVFKSLAAERV